MTRHGIDSAPQKLCVFRLGQTRIRTLCFEHLSICSTTGLVNGKSTGLTLTDRKLRR